MKRIRRCDLKKQAYWEAVVQRWQASGKSVREYCRIEGLQEYSLYFWRRELVRRGRGLVASAPEPAAAELAPAARSTQQDRPLRRSSCSFLPVRVVEGAGAESPRAVEIVLTRGCTVRVPSGFDRQTLLDVLAVLEARAC